MKLRSIVKFIATGALTIGLCVGAFGFANNSALAAVTNRPQIVKTAYNDVVLPLPAGTIQNTGTVSAPVSLPAQATKAPVRQDYTVEISQYSKDLPAGALSANEAAEAGLKTMHDIFGTVLDGRKIEMTALFDLEGRAYWQAGIYEADEYCGGFDVDALSGSTIGLSDVIDFEKQTADIVDDLDTRLDGPDTAYWRDNCADQRRAAEEAAAKFTGHKAVSSRFNYLTGAVLGTDTPEGRAQLKSGEAKPKFAVQLAISVTDEYGNECNVILLAKSLKVTSIGLVQARTSKSDLPPGKG